MLYKDAIEELRNETGYNIVAWAANNKGNGSCNLHVALLEVGVARAVAWRLQTGVVRDGYTAHWRGMCSKSRIRKVLAI